SIEVVDEVKSQIAEAVSIIKKRNVENIFFVSCGGSFSLIFSSKYLVDRESPIIDAHIYSLNEFLYRNDAILVDNSNVYICTISGNTPESVEASKLAKEK